jgi:two-component sensor histidine kinase
MTGRDRASREAPRQRDDAEESGAGDGGASETAAVPPARSDTPDGTRAGTRTDTRTGTRTLSGGRLPDAVPGAAQANDVSQRVVEAVEALEIGVLLLDCELRAIFSNRAFCAAMGVDGGTILGRSLAELAGVWAVGHLPALLADVRDLGMTVEELPLERGAPPHVRHLRLAARRLDGATVLVTLGDVTARHRGDARREILVRELQHRIKNLLSVVQSLFRQSQRRSLDVDELAAAFEGRLQALDRAQSMLLDEDGPYVSLHALARRELTAQGAVEAGAIGDPARAFGFGHGHCAAGPADFSLSGPPMRVDAATGQALGMALHELATNALKHGAMREPGAGFIRVAWSLTPESSTPHGAAPHGAAPDGATPDGATPDGATPDGATPDGATPDGATPADPTPAGMSAAIDPGAADRGSGGPTLTLTWQERHLLAPAADAGWRPRAAAAPAGSWPPKPPAAPRGFGHDLVERSLPAMLGGTAELRLDRDGLLYRLSFPLGPDMAVDLHPDAAAAPRR